MMHIVTKTCRSCPYTCATKSDCYGCSYFGVGYAAYYPTHPIPEPRKDMSSVRRNWKAIQKEHGRKK